MSPVTYFGTVAGKRYEPSPVLNADGSRASIDLSGLSFSLSAVLSLAPR
jgi:hypothetical protein